jgi:hypothetical protein
MSRVDEDKAAYMLGVFPQPGLATGYPDLVGKLNRIYVDRVAKLPWVPPTWLAAVQAIQAKNPGDLIKPTPGYDGRGARGAMAPSFADTDAKLDVWHTIYTTVNEAIVAYAKRQQEEGASELAGLYADAAFWDGAYKLAKFAADLPANIVKGVAGGLTDFVASFLPEGFKSWAKWILWAIVLLVVSGLVLWYRGKLTSIVQRFKGGK